MNNLDYLFFPYMGEDYLRLKRILSPIHMHVFPSSYYSSRIVAATIIFNQINGSNNIP
jgi:hypothetical protein